MMPATLALIRTYFTVERERNLAIAIWGSISVVGAALGAGELAHARAVAWRVTIFSTVAGLILAAVFALPFFQLYSAVGLFDTHIAVALAHCLFNVPLAVWILEGFMSGVPREIDETAAIDGYSFPRFFIKIFMPLIASGIGVAAFFCFMFSWVELLLSRTLTSVNAKPIAATMTRTVSASGLDWGVLAAAGVLTIVPGALVIWFVRNYIAKGFALGRV